MIADLVQELFQRIGHTWKFDKGYALPNSDDIEQVLDEAAKALYDSNVGAQFETGGLIVQKTQTGFDVFAYVGPYF